MREQKKLTIIYDVTTTCPHNCAICCMGAQTTSPDSSFELSISERMKFMDQLPEIKRKRDVKIDFSGGEIFWQNKKENIQMLIKASEYLGKENVGVSSSGFGIDDETASVISKYVSDVEMTMDNLPNIVYPLRPISYAKCAAIALPILKKYRVKVGIQTVLAKANACEENLRNLYTWLCDHDVDNWSLLKFYQSGRGTAFKEQQLNEDETMAIVSFIKKLDEENNSIKKPVIDFHYTIPGHQKYSTECRCVKKSIGILPDGNVTACFWAINDLTKISDDKFLLGNLKEKTLLEILSGDKAKYWTECSHFCELGDIETNDSDRKFA